MSRKPSLAAGIARGLGFEPPSAPSRSSVSAAPAGRVDWQESRPRAGSRSSTTSAATTKVAITIPEKPKLARQWSQSTHNAFHDFVNTKGEPSLNLQREAAGYLSTAASMSDSGIITPAQKERVKDLVAQGNLQQSGRELFWLVLGDQAAAATPPLPGVRQQGGGGAQHRGSSVGGAAEHAALEQRSRKGSSASATPIVVAVSKTTDYKGNEMDQLHNPLFTSGSVGGGTGAAGEPAIAVMPGVVPAQRSRGASIGGMDMYSKTGTAGRKKSSAGAIAAAKFERARAATSAEEPAQGRSRAGTESRLPIERLRSLTRQDSGDAPVYKRGAVECYFPSLARAGIKTWKESQLQLNKKSCQIFKMSDDRDDQGERTVVKTRKEFELKNVDQVRKIADAGSAEYFAFEVAFKGSGQKPLPVRLPSEQERDDWFDAIKNNLDTLWRFH